MSTQASQPPPSTPAYDRYVERAQAREEPTRTRTIRQQYGQRIRGRWDAIMAALRQGIVEFDAFGLRTEALVQPPRDFRFEREADQVEAFDRWLDRQTEREILQRYGGANQWVTRAYEKGVDEAHTELRALNLGSAGDVGAAIRLPIHRDQLQALYTRNFGALQGMTDATANEMRRVLSEGLAGGDGPRDIARTLADRVDAVGRTRATVIGRTEVMHSHNRARATEFERAGVQRVDIIIAPDACPECLALKADAPYPVAEAPSLLPRHPNCRCALTVYTQSSS